MHHLLLPPYQLNFGDISVSLVGNKPSLIWAIHDLLPPNFYRYSEGNLDDLTPSKTRKLLINDFIKLPCCVRFLTWIAGFLLCIKPWFMPGRGSPYAVSHMWYCVMPAWGQQCSCRWPGALMREYLSADALCSYFVWVMSLLAYVWDQPILINSL